MKKNLLLILSLILLTGSCKKDEEALPLLSIGQTEITVPAAGDSQSISFKSNMKWTATSSESWCSVTPSNGDASAKEITVNVSGNDTYDARSCSVTITAGSLSKTLTVNQDGGLDLLITQDKYKLSNEGTTIDVEVKANVEFDVIINDKWIKKIDARSLSTSKLSFEIEKNESVESREGSITIKQKDGALTSTITIFQSQKDAIILSKKTEDLSYDSHELEVELQTNVEVYEVIIPENAKSWVSYTSTRALRTETLILNIAENQSNEDRTTEIYIKDKATDLQEILTINQEAFSGISASPNKFDLTSDATTIEVDVLSNFEFDVIVSGDANWITMIDTRSVSTKKLSFNIAENESYKSREGSITLKEKDGDITTTISIFQSEKKVIILSPKTVELSKDSHELEIELQTSIDDFEVIIPVDAQNWVSYTSTRALRTETLTLNIAKNNDFVRSTEVYVKDSESELKDTITITQNGNEVSMITVTEMGTLSSILDEDQKKSIVGMKLKGQINQADFDVMKDEMPNLRYLDLKDVTCEDDQIPSNAFGSSNAENANKSITTIIFPSSVKTMGSNTFRNCSNLTTVIFPSDSKLTEIGYTAFDTSGLTGTLNLPDGVKTIGGYAFRSCKGLTGSLNLPDGLTTIGGSAFMYCDGFTGTLILPDGITSIGGNAFRECRGFTGDLIIPGGLKTIESTVFAHCTGLDGSLTISNGVTKISGNAFYWAGFTGSLSLPSGLKEIGKGSFNKIGFTGTIAFPLSLESIGESAFNDTDKVDAFRFPHTTPLKFNHLMLPAYATVEVPSSAVASYKEADGWKTYNIIGY